MTHVTAAIIAADIPTTIGITFVSEGRGSGFLGMSEAPEVPLFDGDEVSSEAAGAEDEIGDELSGLDEAAEDDSSGLSAVDEVVDDPSGIYDADEVDEDVDELSGFVVVDDEEAMGFAEAVDDVTDDAGLLDDELGLLEELDVLDDGFEAIAEDEDDEAGAWGVSVKKSTEYIMALSAPVPLISTVKLSPSL